MRILHTSDWHLGKKLQSKARIPEQQKTLEELAYICKNAKIDAVIAAGDIFDTFVPSSEAEELFYSSALEIAQNSYLIAIAGNHDDNERLQAPRGIARASNILLAGGLDNSAINKKDISGGEGWIRLRKNDETLNLALLPYPSFSRIDKLNDMTGDSYEEKIRALIELCCGVFRSGEINIFCSHLFVSGSEACDNELGGAQMIPSSVLPPAIYSALGHIHKPQVASRSKNAHYSGSLLNYSFDDTSKKRYVIIDTDGTKISMEDIPITTGKRTIRERAVCIAEALDVLEKNQGNFVELTYAGTEPLRPSDVTRLKAYDCFCKLNIESVFIKKEISGRKDRTATQLFTDFYQKIHGSAPDDSITELFLKVINGEDI